MSAPRSVPFLTIVGFAVEDEECGGAAQSTTPSGEGNSCNSRVPENGQALMWKFGTVHDDWRR